MVNMAEIIMILLKRFIRIEMGYKTDQVTTAMEGMTTSGNQYSDSYSLTSNSNLDY